MTDALVIIADDYGLGAAHDAVMRDLLCMGAIDGVSVLVEQCSRASARALSSLPNARIGLHFNLTLAPEGTAPRASRNVLLAKSALGFGEAQARRALTDQWDAFKELFGRAPDFIDGHEHCHAFPSIRNAVIAKAAREGVSVRSLVPLFPPKGAKERVLAALGHGLARRARTSRVAQNWRFCGVLPLTEPERAIAELERQLSRAQAAAKSAPGEIWAMVHPGSAEDPQQVAGHPVQMRALEAHLLRRLAPPA